MSNAYVFICLMWLCFTGLAKGMISLLQNMQDNDQRLTMLQLVDKMKVKHKDLGWLNGLV